MKRRVFKKSAREVLRGCAPHLAFALAILLLAVYGLSETERSSKAEGARVLEEGIRRAAVSCYAIEGYYPESLPYIEENYGIRVDSTKYAVRYEVFAGNIMPDIRVFELHERVPPVPTPVREESEKP